jgi:tetratricopeptide (TPR) repeat protein
MFAFFFLYKKESDMYRKYQFLILFLFIIFFLDCHHQEPVRMKVSIGDSMISEDLRKQGIRFALQGDLTTALEIYNKAVDFNPYNASAYGGRGMVQLGLGDIQEAYEDASRAIELDPRNGDWWGNRGYLNNVMGKYKQALEDLNKSVEANPSYSWAYLNRAGVRLTLGDSTGACDDWKTAQILGEMTAADSIIKYCR